MHSLGVPQGSNLISDIMVRQTAGTWVTFRVTITETSEAHARIFDLNDNFTGHCYLWPAGSNRNVPQDRVLKIKKDDGSDFAVGEKFKVGFENWSGNNGTWLSISQITIDESGDGEYNP